MQLNPRYGTDPLITLDGDPTLILGPAVRQHQRLVCVLEGLTTDQWAVQSRCAEWTVSDVVVHLTGTNAFWDMSIAGGRKGEPSQFLANFDPVTTPAQIVSGTPRQSPEVVLRNFVTSSERLGSTLESLSGDDWLKQAESPPGHVSISAVAHHALWDSWVHERDIMLPLGLKPTEEPDEISASLRYGSALGPALAVTNGSTSEGEFAICAENPEVLVVVEISDRVHVREGRSNAEMQLTGEAVDILEALSARTQLSQSVPAASAWMLKGLHEVFDQEV